MLNSQIDKKSPATRFWKIGCAVMLCFLSGCGVLIGFALRMGVEESRSAQCKGKLKLLGLALHNYHEDYGCFPPAYTVDSEGRPMHSWRTLLLPYVDHIVAYHKYDFQQPWNSEHNLVVQNTLNPYLQCPSSPDIGRHPFTNYVAIVGHGTAFPDRESSTKNQLTDGHEQTFLLVEISRSDIQWFEPRDLRFEAMSITQNDPQRPSLSTVHPTGVLALFVDGSVRRLPANLSSADLRAMCTGSGGDAIQWDAVSPVPPSSPN